MMRILGLDEAGRGCVLGPLVVGAYCCTAAEETLIIQSGATDSKKLSAKKRALILKKLDGIGSHRLVSITPHQIDNGNINALEEAAFIDHILFYKPDRVYLDAPTHPRGIPALIKRIQAALAPHMDTIPDLVIEPKADLNYPIVGAASIAAKLNRDAHIHALGDVGSGYPSDPKTRQWLQGFVDRKEDFPPCVRTRWGTISKLNQPKLF